jgi:hypothetical protein
MQQQYEHDLNKALGTLRNQRISVSPGVVGPEGLVFDVMGFMLTAKQILALEECGQLNAHGIREFAKSVEGDPNARTALPRSR